MIIFINGSINSGKSTVASLLAAELGHAALVEIDALRAMIGWMPLEQSIPINLENAALLIRSFAEQGMHVIVPYPLSKKNHDFMLSRLEGIAALVRVFTLAPRLEKALADREARKLTEQERARIAHHYEICIHAPDFGTIIDNSDQTPAQTLRAIMEKIDIHER